MSSSYELDGKTVWFAGGVGSPFPSVTNAPVRYEDIKRQFNKDNLYQDPDFPCTLKDMIGQVGGDPAGGLGTVEQEAYLWCRPKELCDAQDLGAPNFAIQVDDGSLGHQVCSALDVRQGSLGDCWYVCAVQNLTTRQELLKFVIPEDNFMGFKDENYCGAFHFRFFSMYEDAWIDIVVDDKLPAQMIGKRLICPAFADIISKDNQKAAEFWPALIEKAYAKFIGTYADINGGFPSQALEDYTGGFSEILKFSDTVNSVTFGLHSLQGKSPYQVFQQKISHYAKVHFVALCTAAPEDLTNNDTLKAYSQPIVKMKLEEIGTGTGKYRLINKEARKGFVYQYGKVEMVDDPPGLGLNGSHAYSVLDAREVKKRDGSGAVFLVKMRNPHGGDEWKGNYSDRDDVSWSQLDEDFRTRNAQNSTDIDEGVFWMELADIIKYFDTLEACLFGMKSNTKLAVCRGKWPAALQHTSTKATDPSVINNYTAFKFEVKQGSQALAYGGDMRTKAMVAMTVVVGNYKGLWFPNPRFAVHLYELRDDGDVEATRQEIISYRRSCTAMWGLSIGREVSKWTIVNPGTYIAIPVLDTSSVDSIPAALIGKPIPFAMRVFTENETSIIPYEPSTPGTIHVPPLTPLIDKIGASGVPDDLFIKLRRWGYL